VIEKIARKKSTTQDFQDIEHESPLENAETAHHARTALLQNRTYLL
jgi:hypothetical protein